MLYDSSFCYVIRLIVLLCYTTHRLLCSLILNPITYLLKAWGEANNDIYNDPDSWKVQTKREVNINSDQSSENRGVDDGQTYDGTAVDQSMSTTCLFSYTQKKYNMKSTY